MFLFDVLWSTSIDDKHFKTAMNVRREPVFTEKGLEYNKERKRLTRQRAARQARGQSDFILSSLSEHLETSELKEGFSEWMRLYEVFL